MLEHANPIIQSFLQEGYKLSIQAHIQNGRSPRYTAIARRADGDRAQGWGGGAQAALADLKSRSKLIADTQEGLDAQQT